jgi:hypothetical protein
MTIELLQRDWKEQANIDAERTISGIGMVKVGLVWASKRGSGYRLSDLCPPLANNMFRNAAAHNP